MLFLIIAYVYSAIFFLSTLQASEYEQQPPTRRRTLTQSQEHQPAASLATPTPTPIVSVLYGDPEDGETDNFKLAELHEVELNFTPALQAPIEQPKEQVAPPLIAPRRSLIPGLNLLMRACLNSYEDQVKQLIQAHPESVNKAALNGNNSLMWLFSDAQNMSKKALPIVKDLCKANIDLDHRNNLGETALLILLKHTYTNEQQDQVYAILSFLIIEREVSINACDQTRTTPLMYATQYPNIKAVGLLLQKNADVTAVNQQGKSFHSILNSADTPLAIKNLWYTKYHAIYMAIESKNQDIKKMADAYFGATFPQFIKKNSKTNLSISNIIAGYVA